MKIMLVAVSAKEWNKTRMMGMRVLFEAKATSGDVRKLSVSFLEATYERYYPGQCGLREAVAK